jgi:hypothetical protein
MHTSDQPIPATSRGQVRSAALRRMAIQILKTFGPHGRYFSMLNTMARICMRKVINKDNVDTLKSCLSHLPAGTDESCREMNIALRQAASVGKTL